MVRWKILFATSLISCGRISLSLMSFWYMSTNYIAASTCYILSSFLGVLNAHWLAAWYLSSKFGATIDILDDRPCFEVLKLFSEILKCRQFVEPKSVEQFIEPYRVKRSIARFLVATVCTFYSNRMFFQVAMIIDILCHWILLHTFYFLDTTNRFWTQNADASRNPIMRLYYTSRPVLFSMLERNEPYYVSVYLLHFTSGPFFMVDKVAICCFAIAKLATALLHSLVKAYRLRLMPGADD